MHEVFQLKLIKTKYFENERLIEIKRKINILKAYQEL